MKHTTLIIASILLQFSAIMVAKADDEWITISEDNDGMIWQAKSGSLQFLENNNGVPIFLVTGRANNEALSTIEFEKWYVSADDCKKRQGNIVTLDISGEFQYETHFVYGGGNVASGMAEFICESAIYVINEANKKGI